jgi:hypothetical protein
MSELKKKIEHVALSFPCPSCGQLSGDRCRTRDGKVAKNSHDKRLTMAVPEGLIHECPDCWHHHQEYNPLDAWIEARCPDDEKGGE